MDEEVFHECSESAVSSDSICSTYMGRTGRKNDSYIHQSLSQLKPTSSRKVQKSQPTSATRKPNKNMCNECNNNCIQCKDFTEAVCHVNLESLMKLKGSTRKLMYLLEEIDTKTHSKQTVHDATPHLTDLIKLTIPSTSENPTDPTDIVDDAALKRLESQAKNLDAIYIEDEEDDCSIYKRLTRKCNCFNTLEYNDLMILFNEDTKYSTTNMGEIIKNIRILKKFLYMGGVYTKNALLFLNEGLSKSSQSEKVEITQGCAHADICNVFEEHSIVTVCILWPCKHNYCGDITSQALAVEFLYKLAQLEEGRRYLKFSSKITNEMRKILRKKALKLEFDTLELLTATLTLMHPPISQNLNTSFYCKPVVVEEEGKGNKIVNALIQYHQYMTFDEILTHLDLLHSLSNSNCGKTDLTVYLPTLLTLFKQLLIEYDNSEINIVITNILNNIVSENMIKEKEQDLPTTMVITDTAVEPIKMKNVSVQIPLKKSINTKNNKSKYASSQNKFGQQSKQTVSEWTQPRHKKYSKDPRNIIIVPME